MYHYGQITQLHDEAIAFVHDLERHRSHPVNLDALGVEGELSIGDLVAFELDERMRNVRSIARIKRLPGHLSPFFTSMLKDTDASYETPARGASVGDWSASED